MGLKWVYTMQPQQNISIGFSNGIYRENRQFCYTLEVLL